MPIYTNNKAMSNCKIGDKQVAKVMVGDTVVWENWKYATGDINGGAKEYCEYQYGLTQMRDKIPVKIQTRWWWAGSSGSPTGYVSFTFNYKDGTKLTYNSTTSYRDTTITNELPEEYQKPLDTYSWELKTTVGTDVGRTITNNYPKFIAWYEKGS